MNSRHQTLKPRSLATASKKPRAALGLDFGAECVRALIVSLRGRELASAVVKYAHGQITESLSGAAKKLPPHYALQHPLDWLDSAAKAVRAAVRQAKVRREDVVGIGVDFASCTMLPTTRDGIPLCLFKQFTAEVLAWLKLSVLRVSPARRFLFKRDNTMML